MRIIKRKRMQINIKAQLFLEFSRIFPEEDLKNRIPSPGFVLIMFGCLVSGFPVQKRKLSCLFYVYF